ncbi:MAG: methyltransferase domain-containing protein [Thermoanaerobaculia bacterium]
MSSQTPVPGADPYLSYLARFFRFWLPVYDLFAWPIAGVYRAAVRRIAPVPGRAVLDLCTGTGEIALRCVRAGADVTGADVTPAMLAAARRKDRAGAVRWRLADGRALPWPDASFDVVSVSLALHDMPFRVRAEVLAEAARVAREKVVVLDYEMPLRRPWRGLVTRLLALYETAYFPDFVRRGMPAVLEAADLPPVERRVVWRGLFALWEIPAAGRHRA